MNQKSKMWYLSHFNLAKRLKKKELMYLCDNSIMQDYNQTDKLINSYDQNKNIYFLKKGTLKLTRVNEDGHELLTYLIPKGSIFGITQLLTDEYEGNEVVAAMQDSLVCKVSMNLFRELMEKNSVLNNYVLKLSGLKIRKLENKLENVLFKSAEARIRTFIKNFVQEYGIDRGPFFEVETFLKNKDIASLTNSNRQKVNQIMNKMKREKIIDFDSFSLKHFKS